MMKIRLVFFLILVLGLIPAQAIMAESETPKDEILSRSGLQKIAFVSKRDGNFEIYTINEDGTDLKRLTNNKADDLKPQWSPDGTKILFLSKKGRKYELRIMNSDGSDQIKLANECTAKYQPLWSPDGSKIVFVAKSKSKNKIYTIEPNGSNLTCLSEIDTEGTYPSWSPDGSKILYLEKYSKDTYIYVMNSDGTERFRLTRDKTSYIAPKWSSDGKKVAYITKKRSFTGVNYQFNVINSDGSNDMEIAEGSRRIEDIDYYDEFYWSPDGISITFTKVADVDVVYDDNGNPTFTYNYGVYAIRADGNDHARLLAKIGSEPLPPDWTYDSSKIAIVSRSRVTIYNLKTKIDEEIPIDASIPLSPIKWSPDGKKLIFAGKNHSFQKAGLYLVTLDGKVTKLTEDNDYDPVWAPAKEKWDVGSEMLEEK